MPSGVVRTPVKAAVTVALCAAAFPCPLMAQTQARSPQTPAATLAQPAPALPPATSAGPMAAVPAGAPVSPPQAAVPVFPTQVSAKYSSQPAGRARMRTCRDQYQANKAADGNGGLKWIQKGGGYYSQCLRKLKT